MDLTNTTEKMSFCNFQRQYDVTGYLTLRVYLIQHDRKK